MIELRYAKTALRDILDASIHWGTTHTAAPDLLDDEVTRALELLMLFPDIAPRTLTARFKNARKMVLAGSGYLPIYRRESKTRVRILALLAARATAIQP